MSDPVTEQCRHVREQLVEEFGGLNGLFDELEKMDRARLKRPAARKNKKPPRKPSTGHKSSRSKRSK
jgi:hypothetical protein